MFNNVVSPAEERIFQSKLEKLDLTPIREKIAYTEAYKPELLNEMEKWYRRFLFLNFKYNGAPVVPNELIDEFWHYHILDTRKYAADCTALFGEMLHHFPYFGMRGPEDRKNLNQAYEKTKETFLAEYGEIPFMNPVVQEILSNSPAGVLQKAAGCSDCSGAPGTGT